MLCQNLAFLELCQAIRSKVRPANSLIFQPVDHVFYKRINENGRVQEL